MVLSFDCLQYYVKPKDLEKYYSKVDPIFFVVGLNYLPFYGTYPYMAGNGRVTVRGHDNLAYVDVITNGGGSYSHFLINYSARVQSVRMGCATVYFDITKRMWEKYNRIPLPSLSYSDHSLLVNAAKSRNIAVQTNLKPFTP